MTDRSAEPVPKWAEAPWCAAVRAFEVESANGSVYAVGKVSCRRRACG